MILTKPEREAIRALAEKATKGPWTACYPTKSAYPWMKVSLRPEIMAQGTVIAELRWGGNSEPFVEANSRFIAAARTDVPALLDTLDAQDKQIEALRDALDEMIPYARATIGAPESSWPPDNVIIKARAALAKVRP